MAGPGPTATSVRDAILRAFPTLRYAALPPAPLFGAPPSDPDNFPENGKPPGYYVPIPPPPGLKVQERRSVKILGERSGRPWRVDVLAVDLPHSRVPPTFLVEAPIRLLPPGTPPATTLPWMVAVANPAPTRALTWTRKGTLNLVAQQATNAIGRAGLLLQRPLAGVVRPPVHGELYAEAWDPRVTQLLESSTFLERYAAWQRRAGPEYGSSGSMLPVVSVLANRFRFASGLSPSVPPSEHATTLQELMELVTELERIATGLDSERDPMPMQVFHGPMGAVPELRPTYPCPKCGRPEILRRVSLPVQGVLSFRTLGCGADVFPAVRDRVKDVVSSSRAATEG